MVKVLALLSAALLATACGNMTRTTYIKPGSDSGHFRSALQYCRDQASQHDGGLRLRENFTIDAARFDAAARRADYIDQCMQDAGWERHTERV